MSMAFDLAVPLLGIYPKETASDACKDVHTRTLTTPRGNVHESLKKKKTATLQQPKSPGLEDQ